MQKNDFKANNTAKFTIEREKEWYYDDRCRKRNHFGLCRK